MSVQRVCDACGEIIDQSKPFWAVSTVQQQETPEQQEMMMAGTMMPPMAAVAASQCDFHDEHLPDQLRPMTTEVT